MIAKMIDIIQYLSNNDERKLERLQYGKFLQ